MTSIINVNVPTNVKNESNEIFVKLGLNMTTAINIFLKKVIKEKGIPFELKLEAEKDMREAAEELRKIEEERAAQKAAKKLERQKKYNKDHKNNN